MKFLLVLLVVIVAVGIWRSKRRAEAVPHSPPASALKTAQTMVACAHCGLHLPQADAVTDTSGQSFCSAEHRRLGRQDSGRS
ncbi:MULTISPECIES: PP0621 family protein [Comamonas]|jgi:uncharacterized protein|uniref:PP0621 family protein n=1 Tax=Comamonas TaxID=283 RepID=UPI0025D91212|nr:MULTISPECIES: PP0621 family protein [Comamonas]MDR3065714.1 hypothetical protein [Comamonas sp.]MEB5963563.1 hypothetical protein [Comamonas testosteroni]